MSNVKINGNKATEQISATSSYPIKQDKDDTAFGTFQRKVADKSVFRRVVGAATGVVGAGGVTSGVAAMVRALAGLVGAAAAPFVLIGMGALCIAAIIGGIVFSVKNSKENIYIKELNKLLQSDGVEDKIENKKQAISYLNEMISKHKEGSVEYNAAVRSFNENTEIFKLCLESKDRKLFVGTTKFLTEVSKNKCEETKHFVEEIIVDYLNSDSTELNTDAATLLATFLKDNDTKSLAYEIIKSEGFSETIQRFLKSKNNGLKTNTIDLLTEILKNGVTKSAAEGIIKDYIKSDNTQLKDGAIELLTTLLKDKDIQTTTVMQIVKNCLRQGDPELRGSAIRLLANALKSKNAYIETFVKEFFLEENIDLDDENANEAFTGKIEWWLGPSDSQLISDAIKLSTEMLKNENTRADAERFIGKFSEKIGDWLESDNVQLKANTIALLTEMFKSENTDLANTAKKIITDEDVVIEDQGFADIIKSCLGSGNDGLKAKVVELLNNMLVGSDEELKNKSREILKSDVLNTKGMLNIFIKNEGSVNKDAISLLKPMCGDEDMKNILSGLIGKDLVGKLEKQENDVKSDDIVDVLYENVVKEIFSKGNENYIIDLLKNQDGLHNVDINFNENGQITGVKREKLKRFFNGKELNLKALKEQSIKDFGRDLKSIKNAEGDRIINNEESLEKIFENAKISEDAKDLIYKFPGQSALVTRSLLVTRGAQHLCGVLTSFSDKMCSKLNSCGITVNTDGSVEVQMRRIGIISAGTFNLPMAIEEVHTFKIEKGQNVYETTNAKITVYKLEKTGIELTEENLKDHGMLSQVSYNRDEDNNENNKKA